MAAEGSHVNITQLSGACQTLQINNCLRICTNLITMKEPQNVMDLFQNNEIVKICAPMVRYSKLQFRTLVRQFGCDLCFTPMILADSFCKSLKARNNEFTTNLDDFPLITQFAANTVHDFVGAAHLVAPYCNGVDLNCGCPQRWAKKQGLGCIMLENPELIHDLTRQCRNQITKPFTVSVKMRLCADLRKTVELCRQLEHCGADFLTVHSRTPDQLTGEIDLEALKLVNENVYIPIVANGGVKSLKDCYELNKATKCKGVMVANGLLTNPALFEGETVTPVECVQLWVNIYFNTTLNSTRCDIDTIVEKSKNLPFQCFHHHLVFMMEKILTNRQRKFFNNLQTFDEVLTFLYENFQIAPKLYCSQKFERTCLLDCDYSGRDDVYQCLKPKDEEDCDFLSCYGGVEVDGKFFKSKVSASDSYGLTDLFSEHG